MPVIPVGTLVLGLAIAFVAAMIYIGVRFMRESREQKENRAAVRAEIGRRASSKGRAMADGAGNVVWTQHGTLPGGEGWTLAYSVGDHERLVGVSRPTVERDMIGGQQLEWRCSALKSPGYVFSFYRRTDDRKKPEEIRLEGNDLVWSRWRLEAREEATARRAFGEVVCDRLARLPRGIASNTNIDERTSITLTSDGLVAVLGLDDLTPELVDLWLEIGEGMAAGVRG